MPDTSINAFPVRGGLAAGLIVPPPPTTGDVLPITLAVSVVLHAIILLITFAPPVFDGSKFVPHLDVVLVNSKTSSKPVKADGKPLAAGTYQVRLTQQTPTPDAKGQSASLERWVEFVKGGKIAGREVVTIIPQSEISQVQKDTPPKANGSKVEALKGGDYQRLWINKGGNHYLVHFPVA